MIEKRSASISEQGGAHVACKVEERFLAEVQFASYGINAAQYAAELYHPWTLSDAGHLCACASRASEDGVLQHRSEAEASKVPQLQVLGQSPYATGEHQLLSLRPEGLASEAKIRSPGCLRKFFWQGGKGALLFLLALSEALKKHTHAR